MAKKKLQGVEKPYKVVLSDGSKEYSATGETIAEGIGSLEPILIKNRMILTVEKDGKKTDMEFYPVKLRKLLVNKIYQIIIDKWLNAKLNA